MSEGSFSLTDLAPNSQVVAVIGIIGILWMLYLIEGDIKQNAIETRALRHDLRAYARGDIHRQVERAEPEESDESEEGEEGNSQD